MVSVVYDPALHRLLSDRLEFEVEWRKMTDLLRFDETVDAVRESM